MEWSWKLLLLNFPDTVQAAKFTSMCLKASSKVSCSSEFSLILYSLVVWLLCQTYNNFTILDLNSVLDGLISKSSEAGGPVRYSCLSCGKSMADKAKMRRHAEVHLDMNHPCIVCGKNFKTRNALSIHYTRYHGQEVVSPWTTSWNMICRNFSFNK